MKRSQGIFEIAREVLEQAGRPLNVRAIIRLALRDGLFSGAVPDADELQSMLEEAAAQGACVEVRKGIFSLQADESEVQEMRKMERHSPVPASIEEAAAGAESGRDDRSLRQKLWKNLRSSVAHQLGLPQEESAPNDAQDAPAPQAENQTERPLRSRERRAEARRREREAASENKAFENQTETKAEPKEETQRRRETAHKAADQLKAASKAAVAKSAAKGNVKEAPEKPVAQANLRIADRLREKLGVARKARMPQLNEILEQAAQKQAEKMGAVEAIDLSDAVENLLQRLRAHWEKSPLPKPQPVEQPARFEQKFEPKSEQKIEQKSEAPVSEPRRARSRRDLGRATQQAAAAQPVEVESSETRIESRRFESKRDDRRESVDRRERRERIEKAGIEKTERRGARFSLQSADALLAVAYETLQQSGSPMAGPVLMEAVEKRLSARGLKSAIVAENARRLSMGLRPRFALCNDGTVALTEWKLSPRYLEAERQFEKAQLGLHEALKAELLLKIANLRDGAFAGLLAMLLERMGYSSFGAVQQQGGLWQFTALLAGQKVAFAIQRRSAQAGAYAQWCDALEETGAKRGLWVALGEVSETPEQASSAVEFVDGAAFAGWLCQAELGVLSHKFVDEAFFESLA